MTHQLSHSFITLSYHLTEDTRTENTVQKTVFAAISHIDGGKQSKIIFKNDVIRIACVFQHVCQKIWPTWITIFQNKHHNYVRHPNTSAEDCACGNQKYLHVIDILPSFTFARLSACVKIWPRWISFLIVLSLSPPLF